MSEEFTKVENTEDRICEIMDLFCSVQTEIVEELVNQSDDLLEDNLIQQELSVTNRSNVNFGNNSLETKIS